MRTGSCTQTLIHAEVLHRRSCTQMLLHRRFYTQLLLHTHTVASAHKCLTHRLFYIHPLHAEMLYNFTQTNFYTELIYVNFTHRNFCAQILLHTDAFAQRCLFTQKTLPTEGFFYTEAFAQILTQMLLHTDSFDTHTHKRRFYTQALNTQVLLRTVLTGAFTHRSLYKKNLSQTKNHTHTHTLKCKLLDANTFSRRCFYTQKS